MVTLIVLDSLSARTQPSILVVKLIRIEILCQTNDPTVDCPNDTVLNSLLTENTTWELVVVVALIFVPPITVMTV